MMTTSADQLDYHSGMNTRDETSISPAGLDGDIYSEDAFAAGEFGHESLPVASRILVLVYLAAAAAYLIWRPITFNTEAMLFSSLVFGAELFGFLLTAMHLTMTWRLTRREPPAPQYGHSVDVFIATINEPIDMVRRTAQAAARMDYPHLTWILDDGNRAEIRALAEELGCRYLYRTENTHAKAGNLNNALQQTQGQFVAFFDADHAPRRDFLMRTLGYFRDRDVAFVQTPQDFYNLDSYEHRQAGARRSVWMEQSFFWRVIQRGKDWWNAAFFCGSCAVMRRSALEAVGGIATESVTEDLHTSLRLHKKGYRSVYHAEPLAFGVAPASIQQYLKQRLRWGQGAMQVWRKEGILFARGLGAGQRLCYMSTLGAYLEGWQKAIFYVAPAFVLLTGIMPIADFGAEFFLRFIPYYLLTFLVFEEMSRGFGKALVIEQYNMARFAAFMFASLGFFRDKLKFAVTSKALSTRGRGLLSLAPQIAVLGLNAIAIPLGLVLQMNAPTLTDDALAANIFWALVNSGLAAVLLRFNNRRANFRRAEYRFPVPLPARLRLPDQAAAFGTIDDISSNGFSFYGRLAEPLSRDAPLHIDIFLPTTVISVKARIRSLHRAGPENDRYVKSIGCSFAWEDRDQQDQLSVFLYASDMQWKINGLSDKGLTPVQKLGRWLRGIPQRTIEAPPRWAPVLIQAEGSLAHLGPTMGIVSIGARQRQIITVRPIPAGAPLRLRAFSRRGITILGGIAELIEKIATPTQPLSHYLLHRRQETADNTAS